VAVNTQGESPLSAEATVTAAAFFTSAEIGNPTPAGSTTTITPNSAYDVTGGGVDVWGTSDSFRFVYRAITGDFDISVRVDGVTAASTTTSLAGLMARADLTASSRNVYQRTDNTNRFRFASRTSTGGTTASQGSTSAATGQPRFLRLVRTGSTFTGFHSTDGVNWTQTGTVTMSMPATMFVGMAVCSKNTAQTTTANFRQLTGF
jgi:regulation of enolase protein 1 (concanavalin A-like superfamily)